MSTRMAELGKEFRKTNVAMFNDRGNKSDSDSDGVDYFDLSLRRSPKPKRVANIKKNATSVQEQPSSREPLKTSVNIGSLIDELLQNDNGEMRDIYKLAEKGDLEKLKEEVSRVGISKVVENNNEEEKSCLYYAVASGHEEVVKYVLEIGIIINQLVLDTQTGKTTDWKIVRLLIDRLIDDRSKSVIDIRNLTKSLAVLSFKATSVGEIDIFKSIISLETFSVNVKHLSSGQTMLSFAANKNQIEILQWLLEVKNAEPNIVDLTMKSPLHYAAAKGHHKIMDLLVKNGAKVDAITKDNKCALYYVTRSGSLQSLQYIIVEMSKIKGSAETFQKAKKYAVKHNQPSMISYIDSEHPQSPSSHPTTSPDLQDKSLLSTPPSCS